MSGIILAMYSLQKKGILMTKPFSLVLLISLLAVFIAACSPPPPPPILPTRIPPTRISTHIAPVATGVPAGFNQDNPIHIVIVPANFEAATATDMESELQALLEQLTDVVLEVSFVETQPEAVGLLCNSDSGTVSAAWLNGFAFAGATASECGIPTLALDRNTEGASDTSEAGVILLNIAYFETGLAGLVAEADESTETDSESTETPEPIDFNSNFCRTSISDFYSWTIPLMAFGAENIAIADLDDVIEMEDYDALIEGMISGECAVIGLPETVWEAYDSSGNIPSDTMLVAETSAQFPHHAMVFPFAATLAVIEPISDEIGRAHV